MGINPFECPKCGGIMFNDLMRYGYRCFSCGNHEPFGHNANAARAEGGSGEAEPGPGEAARAGAHGAGGHAATDRAKSGRGTADTALHSSTLGLLASIICTAYSGAEITALLGRSGQGANSGHFGTDWKSLYGEFERIQRNSGPYGIIGILEAACGAQDGPGVGGMREKFNECLSTYGFAIGEDGAARKAEAAGALGDSDAALFDQGGYHELVIEHARAKFLKGEYSSSVTECCKALEGLVRARSGIDGYGARLMKGALGAGGVLEVDPAGLTSATRDSMQRGLADLCVGMVSGVRNPVAHETEASLRIGRADALHILGTISYLCKRVEGTRRRQDAPTKGVGRGTAGSGAGGRAARMAPQGAPDGRGAAGATGQIDSLSVGPESVVQRDTVTVTVAGRGIGGWYVGVLSEEGEVKSSPARLGAHGAVAGKGGASTYRFSVNTLNYGPGEYRVSVSSNKTMDSDGMRIKKFMVYTYEDMMDAIRGRPGMAQGASRDGRLHGDPRGRLAQGRRPKARLRGHSNGLSAGLSPDPAMGAKISIEPDPVEQGNTIAVAVGIPGGGDLSSWHMRIVSAQDPAAIKLAPRGLDAYGAPRDGATDAYDCKIAIIGFEPGEYIVDLAPGGRFDTPEMASKKFTVRPARVIVASASWAGSSGSTVLGGTPHILP